MCNGADDGYSEAAAPAGHEDFCPNGCLANCFIHMSETKCERIGCPANRDCKLCRCENDGK